MRKTGSKVDTGRGLRGGRGLQPWYLWILIEVLPGSQRRGTRENVKIGGVFWGQMCVRSC